MEKWPLVYRIATLAAGGAAIAAGAVVVRLMGG